MKFNIRTKLITICLILLVIPGLIIGLIGYVISKNELNNLAETSLKNSVNLSLKTIELVNQKVESGSLTLEQAQEEVKKELLGEMIDGKRPITKEIDLGPNGYLYAIDDKGNLLMHPVLEGDNLYEAKTKDGFYFLQDVIKKSAQGGFTYYEWALPNNPDKTLQKLFIQKKILIGDGLWPLVHT
ncbi:cache domain-containing protein [Bacillus sp. 31A1R]|uniref:Cache domain-containing protein n=1 Tax=Robertmurraya mangrovi TaxID=3098077 RepID=A0ABU5ITU0_9BACI|nr:cache domain-containing protein [Bacillus sp. 31A1R]MDZ5470562.1 cache domain-containing protein [Bacillus sp. 31A1R]